MTETETITDEIAAAVEEVQTKKRSKTTVLGPDPVPAKTAEEDEGWTVHTSPKSSNPSFWSKRDTEGFKVAYMLPLWGTSAYSIDELKAKVRSCAELMFGKDARNPLGWELVPKFKESNKVRVTIEIIE